MNLKKPLIAAALMSTLGIGVVGVGSAFAASSPDKAELGPKAEMTAIVNAIAAKFNLNAADVQQVVTDEHKQFVTERHDAIEQKFTDKITQAVKDGKLTQTQADMLTAKKAEVKTFIQSLEGKPAAERQAAIKIEAAALKAWANDNHLPMDVLNSVFKNIFGLRGRHEMIVNGVGER